MSEGGRQARYRLGRSVRARERRRRRGRRGRKIKGRGSGWSGVRLLGLFVFQKGVVSDQMIVRKGR